MRRMVGTILMALSLCLAGLGGLVIASGTVGAASASSGAVPGAPTHLIGISRYRSVRISWTAPTNHGSSAIDRYEVIELSGSSTCSTGPTARTCVVPNLVTGSTHTFKVRAFNAVGAGPFSSGIPVKVGRPMPPANLAGTPGDWIRARELDSGDRPTGDELHSYGQSWRADVHRRSSSRLLHSNRPHKRDPLHPHGDRHQPLRRRRTFRCVLPGDPGRGALRTDRGDRRGRSGGGQSQRVGELHSAGLTGQLAHHRLHGGRRRHDDFDHHG